MDRIEKIIANAKLHAEYMDARWRQIMETGTPYVRFFDVQPETDIAEAVNSTNENPIVFKSNDPDIRIPPFNWTGATGIGPISERKFERDGLVVARFKDMRKYDGILPEFDFHPNSPDRNIAALIPSEEDVIKYLIHSKKASK